MEIGILTVLLFLGLITVRLVLFPSEVIGYLQVPSWIFWFVVISTITWILKD
ncbi:MAG TPA: hypothetical protein VL134_01735 [Leptolyngbya sp.]|nr:hypothetical protein [Leptolyngbya sp.]